MAGSSRTLLLAFGGIAGRIGIPPFEFFSMTTGMPAKRLFVRDLRQAWYHRGIPNHGGSIAESADSLRELLEREQIDRLVVAGTSAGGYAALVFGALLGADAVVCFAPQTVLDLEILTDLDDHRWDERLAPQWAAGTIDARFSDLRRVLEDSRRAGTTYRIYFAGRVRADRLHAERIAGIEGVRLFRFGSSSHNIARTLRDSGALQRVLRAALQAPDAAHGAVKSGHRPTSISG
jgi:pimeloyl-ACP methyl ester carboxylesterase